MCGITGFWEFEAQRNVASLRETITNMTNVMYRRGPDSGGAWVHPKLGLALGHRRLAIRDLSPNGHQPMTTSCGRYTIVYNGEIYNTEELRAELVNCHQAGFRSRSDTEALLQSCAVWGVEATVQKLLGMFAFAFWDAKTRKLTLARDRLGVKPLYWGKLGPLFLFASELKPLCQLPGWTRIVNRDAVAELMRCGYIPAPLSIYEGIEKLRPGHLLEVNHRGRTRDICYWDPREVMKSGTTNRLHAPDQELIGELDRLLRDAVRRRLVSDVPLGAFLSGGIDSSLVTALMQAESTSPVRTFSIGFEESEYDESPYAKAVARHLGTQHTGERMTIQNALELIPRMAEIYDEPFSDSSQLPTCLLALVAKKHVTVTLSGDGGDELFAGYTRYFNFIEKFPNGQCPDWKQHIARRIAPLMSADNWDHLVKLIPARYRPGNFGTRLRGFARRSKMTSGELYRQIGLGHWPDPTGLVIGSRETESIFGDVALEREIPDPIERMQFLDSVHYLPDDILVKVDRATMAMSLEARVPILDHRVYEYTWKLPRHMRVRGEQGKWILRQVLYRYLPQGLVDRPKTGFGVPIDRWLRGDLRDWAEALMDPVRLHREGYLDSAVVNSVWQRHLRGENYHYWLWNVLMFQSWLNATDHARPSSVNTNLPVFICDSHEEPEFCA